MLDRPFKPDMTAKVLAPGIAPMLNAFNPAAVYMESLNNSALQLSGKVAESWLHFFGDRCLMDLRFPQQLAACKTAEDFTVAFSEFWQQASRDYSVEFNKIAHLTLAAMHATDANSSVCAPKDSKGCCGKCSSKQPGIG